MCEQVQLPSRCGAGTPSQSLGGTSQGLRSEAQDVGTGGTRECVQLLKFTDEETEAFGRRVSKISDGSQGKKATLE